ncbi:unnamed protein product [Vitrella brassicaformis CCMP3155]|uniref:Uncharacterized protein n=1 Tax=Vitrella brassicaformis (strain CCMP3155) TaxID=1169540 RepID=A0A0G4F9R1_VITBC|nr:unnamed protein product [Vitrella brassicaformis CCMP3155]|eukprot:CEM09125.1 unnamed protein product [Vitrella brassicaformis CCMP3155]
MASQPLVQTYGAGPLPEVQIDISRWQNTWSDGVLDCFSHWPSCLVTFFGFGWLIKAISLNRSAILKLTWGLAIFGLTWLAYFVLSTTGSILRNQESVRMDIADKEGGIDNVTEDMLNAEVWEHHPAVVALGFLAGAFAVAMILLNWYYRTKIREKYHIPPTDCAEDFFVVCCCMGCSVCQGT